MKAILSGAAVALVLAVGAAYVLGGSFQRHSSDAGASLGVRVGDPGHNFVGY